MDVVSLIFKAWRALGLLYAEWRKEWPAEYDAKYKQQRAMLFLDCAIAFGNAMADVSYKKHKSWYVFLTIWVVPRQIAARGDLFPYSTAPIEHSGERA